MGRTVKQPEVRRQEILEAALDLFCEKGYEGASMADLAQRLGISQGLCYRYFPCFVRRDKIAAAAHA